MTARIVGLVLMVVIVVGAALRIWQYTGNTSLWLDEIALVRGILDLNLWNLLTTPLPYDQVASKGFLLVQKLAVIAMGPSDYALRLFPFACSLISLVVFGRLAMRMLDGVGPLAAMVLFATAAPLVEFSALVKQYSTDVCVAVLLSWLTYELTSRPVTAYRAGWAALIGATLIWFSQPGVLMITAFGGLLAMWPKVAATSAWRRRTLVPLLACWGTSALAVTIAGFASMSPATREYMHRFWAAGFPPVPLARMMETFWPWDQIRSLFGSGPEGQAGLAYPLPTLYAVLTAIGFGLLWGQNRRAAVLLMAPLAMALSAAVARQYPFSDRLILFLVPSFILAIAAAIEGLRRLLWPLSRPLGALVAVGLLSPAVYPVAVTPPVYRTEHVKALLSHVQARRQPGDEVYVYYGAAPVMSFYAPQYGFGRSEYAVGGCHRGDGRRYLQELDTFRGRSRVWVLLTHALPRYREREDILAYLDTIGARKDSLVVQSRAVGRNPLPAEVYLYDLSAAHELTNGAADAFQLTGPSSADQRFGCGEGPQAMVRTDFR